MEKARETFCLFLSTFFLFLSKKRHRKMLIGKKIRAQNMGPDTFFLFYSSVGTSSFAFFCAETPALRKAPREFCTVVSAAEMLSSVWRIKSST